MLKGYLKKLLPSFILDLYYQLWAFLGALIYGFPSRHLIVVGVTGTNGKSTVVELIAKILEKAGFNVASVSSIKFKIKDFEKPNLLKMTMPGRMFLQRFLKKAVKAGCKYAVIEVTSEGIKQFRHKFIDFDVAVFTNLRPEHIESHGSFEKYREAKMKLFEALSKSKKKKEVKKVMVVNLDDQNAEYFLKFPADQKWGYKIAPTPPQSPPPSRRGGIKGGEGKEISNLKCQISNLKKGTCDFVLEVKEYFLKEEGISFKIKDEEFNLKLKGLFNLYNALAAICTALSQKIDLEVIKEALEEVKGVEGRLEEVISKPFKVYVDYAHTPDALEEVYKTLINKSSKVGKLICVFGACGGGRDRWKRPKFGEIAEKYCRLIFLTNEDPYDEDPEKILEEIEAGIKEKKKVRKILNRREAICQALKEAKENDIVIITGKGCEPWMCVKGGKKIPWDDRKIVKEEFQKLFSDKL